MKKIYLSGKRGNGKYALVDDEDYQELNKYRWSLNTAGKGYAVTYPNYMNIAMHRLLMGFPKGKSIDHINGNSLDNRKSNLRIVSHKVNMINRRFHKNNKSGYRGVRNDRSYWKAEITVDNKTIYLGYFNNPEEAAKAYDSAAKHYFGQLAKVNFK